MDKTLNYGIDGWKCDGSDFLLLKMGITYYSPGAGGNVSRLDYSHKYYQIFHDYTREKLGNDRVITCRPIDNYGFPLTGDAVAFCPKDISWACWVGDQDATFDGMKAALENMYQSSQYGYLSFGSDIGGYRNDNAYPQWGRSKELFLRWAQLGTFCGVMENGGGGEHRPWMFDDETNTIYKRFAFLREKLVPYLMKTAETRFPAGTPLMHFYNNSNYSFLLGEDVFVRPMVESGSDIPVSIPSGSNWVYVFDKTQVCAGGSTQYLTIPLNEFPVFTREGSEMTQRLK